MPKLRDYQQRGYEEIHESWHTGAQNVLLVLPTGAGKTVLFSKVLTDHAGAAVAIAHRQELVGQMSMALAGWGVDHNILAPTNVIKLITRKQLAAFGRTYFNPQSNKTVAGVDTLRARSSQLENWFKLQSLWVMDEAHHILKKNKWGTVIGKMPGAKGLGVTATPLRADGHGLSRSSHGVFDHMLVGPSMRDLINSEYLTDYIVYCPPNDIDLKSVDISKTTGDYSKTKLSVAAGKSHIVGDVVDHYLKYAPGKRGITFATDVEMASRIALEFTAKGVPAEVVSHRTPDNIRSEIVERFDRGELLQLVNVDLFGEGFDLPAIEVASFARPTQSYALFVQQFGRALRLHEGKERAIILDHAGNTLRHGLPDRRVHWSLEPRSGKAKAKTNPDEIPTRVCPNCLGVYERVLQSCPYCGTKHQTAQKGRPDQVDGELVQLDDTYVNNMEKEAHVLRMTDTEYRSYLLRRSCPTVGIERNIRSHAEDRKAQEVLAAVILMWNPYVDRPAIQKQFYWQFQVDLLTVRTFKHKQAQELMQKIWNNIDKAV